MVIVVSQAHLLQLIPLLTITWKGVVIVICCSSITIREIYFREMNSSKLFVNIVIFSCTVHRKCNTMAMELSSVTGTVHFQEEAFKFEISFVDYKFFGRHIYMHTDTKTNHITSAHLHAW